MAIHGCAQTSAANDPIGSDERCGLGTRGIIAIVDHRTSNREHLSESLRGLRPADQVLAFQSVDEMLSKPARSPDFIVLSICDNIALGQIERDHRLLRSSCAGAKIILLSDALCGLSQTIISPLNLSAEQVSAGIDIFAGDESNALTAPITPEQPARSDPVEAFTKRQFEVLRELAEGKPNKMIAHDLQMGEGTVKIHVRAILRKLKATNRTQAAHLAREFVEEGPRLAKAS